MKKLLAVLLITSTALASAQTKVVVTEGVVAIDGVSRNSLSTIIEGANANDVKKAWKKRLKDLKGKVNDKKIIFGDNCQSKEMGDNSFDVYSVVEDATKDGVKLVVAFDLGGAYLSTVNHPGQYPAGEKIVYTFAVEQAKAAVQVEIDNNNKILSGLEKDFGNLEKEKAGLEKDIADYEKKIEAAKADIEKNIVNQANKLKEIEGLKAVLVTLDTKINSVR
ncbi:hypothetical protein ACFLR1_01210 [Bacteroidota bacterium]